MREVEVFVREVERKVYARRRTEGLDWMWNKVVGNAVEVLDV